MEWFEVTRDGRPLRQIIREAVGSPIVGASYHPGGADFAVALEGRVLAVMVELRYHPLALRVLTETDAIPTAYPLALLERLDAPAVPGSQAWRERCRWEADRRRRAGRMDPIVWWNIESVPGLWRSAPIEILRTRSVDGQPHALQAVITTTPPGVLWAVEDHWLDTRDVLARGGASSADQAQTRAEQELREIWQDIRRGSPVL